MAIHLSAAMRKAAALTRASKLLDATRAIQSALSGEPARAPRQQGSAGDGAAVGARSLELEGTRVHTRPAEPQVRPEPAPQPATLRQAPFDRLVGERVKRPLAEVLGGLRLGKFDTGRPFASPGGRTAAAPPHPPGAQFLARSFANAAGSRDYKLYMPARAAEGPRPLLVMLHGCTQDPDDFAAGTGMNALAEEHGFLVAYPAQTKAANQMGCWNWFDPKDQLRDAGEPAIIAGITREIMAGFDVDPAKVFVAGLSAGGAMAAVMGQTYPDLFSAIGIHSGLAYGAASDVPGAFMAMRGEDGLGGVLRRAGRSAAEPALPVRTIVFHGDADQTVHPSNADRIVAALAHGIKPSAHEKQAGAANGRSYSRTQIRDAAGRPLGENWVIAGAGHAWSGGNPAGSYADPQGPNASREMVRFFLETHAPIAMSERRFT